MQKIKKFKEFAVNKIKIFKNICSAKIKKFKDFAVKKIKIFENIPTISPSKMAKSSYIFCTTVNLKVLGLRS